ncbi:hypothetical protein PVW48_10375 [Dinoroseobacter sp. PD6]|uniref:hypothetical protein n=1 Tax=Dinoroseobacter sp. PD6 TaxID=3028384 RepID=UPI00237B1C7B|nr:hypothetical protein [Dinoroseobacter sp. PD6]MDD9717152.1 hypothetical protein [Dinoroseobacter sp. PD6]
MNLAFLKTYKDEIASTAAIISIISAIVLIVSVVISARQFYLARQAVQAQAIGTSLAHGRDLYDALAANADLAERLFGVEPPQLEETVFVQKTLSFFSEQYIYRDGGLIDDETWELVQRDMCQTYQSPGFLRIAAPLLERGDFPSDFTDILRGCSIAQ